VGCVYGCVMVTQSRIGKNSGHKDLGPRDPLLTSVSWNFTLFNTFCTSTTVPVQVMVVNACHHDIINPALSFCQQCLLSAPKRANSFAYY